MSKKDLRKPEDGLHELSEFELAEFKQAFKEFDEDSIWFVLSKRNKVIFAG